LSPSNHIINSYTDEIIVGSFDFGSNNYLLRFRINLTHQIKRMLRQMSADYELVSILKSIRE